MFIISEDEKRKIQAKNNLYVAEIVDAAIMKTATRARTSMVIRATRGMSSEEFVAILRECDSRVLGREMNGGAA